MQRGGKTGPHQDGWGVAFYEGKGCRIFQDHLPSFNSEIAKLVRKYPIKSRNVICHIRKANRGKICLENTHPFVRHLWGRNWCFAHNGQLKGIKKLALKRFDPVGSTDSEYAFCWLLDQITARYTEPPNARQQPKFWAYIESLCLELSQLGIFNILFSDSKYLYAFCSTKLVWITRRAPFGKAKLVDDDVEIDFHMETTPHDVVTVIATAPLTDNEAWFKAEKKEFLVFHQGELLNKFQ